MVNFKLWFINGKIECNIYIWFILTNPNDMYLSGDKRISNVLIEYQKIIHKLSLSKVQSMSNFAQDHESWIIVQCTITSNTNIFFWKFFLHSRFVRPGRNISNVRFWQLFYTYLTIFQGKSLRKFFLDQPQLKIGVNRQDVILKWEHNIEMRVIN